MTDLTQIDRFVRTLAEHEKEFGIELSASDLACLSDYYRIVMRENALLHLVAPCSPEEFAVRHILESLTTLEFLPSSARFADVGAGAGLPSLPCLLVREGLRGLLIESKQKKAGFLGRAISELRLEARASVAPTQFQEVEDKDLDAVASRALDRFTERLPRLIKWAGRRRMLLFGGEDLREGLRVLGLRFKEKLMPLSERRYLFVVDHEQA
jgi:16S rRNA (guanine(527)-N(7))-methyltransferase RsmG